MYIINLKSYTVIVIKTVICMKVKGICISIFRKTKLKFIILFGIFIAVLLMIVSFILIFKTGENVIIYNKSDIFNATSYYTEYKLKVFSNKNQNEYKIKEWYKKENEGYKFKFETNNENNINFVYEGDNKNINIYSNEQLNKISFSDIFINKENLISISTFIDVFSKIDRKIEDKEYDVNKCCKILESHEDGKISYKITFNINESKKCDICNRYTSGMNITQIELIINEETLKPTEYIIYGTNENALYDITYENFDVNVSFE